MTGSLPDDAKKREEYPMAGGLLDYFPNALAEVARLSFVATQQHHSGQPMHWDRSKSRDHRSKIIRHLIDTGKVDDKGMRHSAAVAWRALALLQEELEEQEGYPMSRASRTGMPSNPANDPEYIAGMVAEDNRCPVAASEAERVIG